MSDIIVRPTAEADIPFVCAAEQHPENAPLIGQWSPAEHRAALANNDLFHGIITRTSDAASVGYMIFAGRENPHGSIELRRLVIVEKGQGFGRHALRLAKALAFNMWDAHRLWLDVVEHNTRAQRLYASEGFRVEGILRECQRTSDDYLSFVVMSILEVEFAAE